MVLLSEKLAARVFSDLDWSDLPDVGATCDVMRNMGTRERKRCCFDVLEDEVVWMKIKLFAADFVDPKCWLECMDVDPATQERKCDLYAQEGLESIEDLCGGSEIFEDDGLTYKAVCKAAQVAAIFKPLLDQVRSLGYVEGVDLVAAPYDSRISPSKLDAKFSFFSNLKIKIEELVISFETKGCEGGAVILAHSLGNNILRYFTYFLEFEMGKENAAAWMRKNMESLVLTVAPLLGAPSTVDSFVSGYLDELDAVITGVTKNEVRSLTVSYGSVPLMLPIPTDDTKTDSAHNKINCDRGDYGEPVLKFTSSDFGEGITFTSVPDEDINPQDRESAFKESGQMKEVDPLLLRMETVLKTHYREHEIARRMLEPWYDPPSVNNINCFYGIDLDKVANYKYRANANPGDEDWEQEVGNMGANRRER
ncbi:hypothetical protein TL16_g11910 [Triparma laevis f. inornata]|uniref:Uncharacterized protein n=2 Tax=Triparma laevis TaxID=1534972 RepID=A0A9W7EAE3_9STRA|nr:hypothetical protein TrLO_g13847 [Triparma laevis f. longispina]GMH90935.1 hypothetical protein TL16_g11910 [Triparma laevis f. inornata]